ncbi:unnamed protein product, partial [Protopolystoma xenopodis]
VETSENESFNPRACGQTLEEALSSFPHSSNDQRPGRSRKQNIRELREEFEDDPELYGIRRSSRCRKEPMRYETIKPDPDEIRKSRRHHRADSSDYHSEESSTDSSGPRWSRISVEKRSVRTRGNRVNYKEAFVDENFSSDDGSTRPHQAKRSAQTRCQSHSGGYAGQQWSIQKPRGSLVRQAKSENRSLDQNVAAFKASRDRDEEDEDEEYMRTESGSLNRDSAEAEDPDQIPDEALPDAFEEADMIEEVLSHAIRRRGATGNPTTMYNVRLEKDLNAGFDGSKEEGELQFLIKWRNWSHIHSTWETEASLKNPSRVGGPVNGLKKLYDYKARLRERKEFEKLAEMDELEALAYEEERNEQILSEKMTVERIIAHSRDRETGTFDYLIKWCRLDYRFC